MKHNINDIALTIKNKYPVWNKSTKESMLSQLDKLINEANELKKAIELNAKNLSNEQQFMFSERNMSSYERLLKNSVKDEIADCIIVILGMAGSLKMDVFWWIQQKLRYNKQRGYEKEARAGVS